RRRHTRFSRDWSSDVCSSDLEQNEKVAALWENERLIKEQNVYLEKMVLSRTEELEHALKNLQNTQTQLVNQEKMASLGQLTAGKIGRASCRERVAIGRGAGPG